MRPTARCGRRRCPLCPAGPFRNERRSLTEPRLAAHVEVSALIRRASGLGEFAALVHRGDPVSGAIMLLVRFRDGNVRLYERFPSLDGRSEWTLTGPAADADEIVKTEYIAKRRASDPDLWVIELDIGSAEQLGSILSQVAD